MNACQLYMLHDSGHKGVCAVRYGVCLALQSMVQKSVYQYGPVGCHAYRSLHVLCHGVIIIYHFHAAAAQHVGRTHHYGITDAGGYIDGLLHCGSHSGFGHGDLQLVHHLTELVPVLSQVYHLGRGAQYPDAVGLEL